jgi:hypothetical protein
MYKPSRRPERCGAQQDVSSLIPSVPHYDRETDKVRQKQRRFVQPCQSCLVTINIKENTVITAVAGKCHVLTVTKS